MRNSTLTPTLANYLQRGISTHHTRPKRTHSIPPQITYTLLEVRRITAFVTRRALPIPHFVMFIPLRTRGRLIHPSFPPPMKMRSTVLKRMSRMYESYTPAPPFRFFFVFCLYLPLIVQFPAIRVVQRYSLPEPEVHTLPFTYHPFLLPGRSPVHLPRSFILSVVLCTHYYHPSFALPKHLFFILTYICTILILIRASLFCHSPTHLPLLLSTKLS